MCWVNDEMKTVNFGDVRLDARMAKILRELGDKPAYSIPQAMGGWAETIAAYRFFDNDKVTYEQVLKPHYDATLERIKQQPVVLLPQDTTDIIKVTNKGSKGLGNLSLYFSMLPVQDVGFTLRNSYALIHHNRITKQRRIRRQRRNFSTSGDSDNSGESTHFDPTGLPLFTI